MATRRCRTIPSRPTSWARSTRRARKAGLPHDDPRLGLSWPLPVTAISARDRSFRSLDEIEGELRRRMHPDLQLLDGGAAGNGLHLDLSAARG